MESYDSSNDLSLGRSYQCDQPMADWGRVQETSDTSALGVITV